MLRKELKEQRHFDEGVVVKLGYGKTVQKRTFLCPPILSLAFPLTEQSHSALASWHTMAIFNSVPILETEADQR